MSFNLITKSNMLIIYYDGLIVNLSNSINLRDFNGWWDHAPFLKGMGVKSASVLGLEEIRTELEGLLVCSLRRIVFAKEKRVF